MPPKNFRHFFAKMAKTILFLWPDFALTADAPSLYQSPSPLLPLKNKSKKSTKEIKKKFLIKDFTLLNLNECPEAFVKRK